jgi:O-antigen/teichoic acid export membrane protein
MNRTKRFISNTSYNFLSQIWFIVLNLAVTPYIVHKLGLEAYGIFAILNVLIGYFSIMDLGIGAASIKYISDYLSKDDRASLKELLKTSFTLYLIIGFLGAITIIPLTGYFIIHVFHISKPLISTARTVFYIAGIGLVIHMPLIFFRSILMALQRFDILVKRNLVLLTSFIAGEVLLLYFGFGLIHLVLLNVFIEIINVLIFWHDSKKLLPELSIKPSFHINTFKTLGNFGIMKFLNQIASQAVFQLDRVLIGIFMPIAWVTYYVVPVNLSQKLMSWQGNITTVYFPLACELIAKNEKEKLILLYTKLTKYIFILVLPLALILFVFSNTILELWMHGDFAAKSGITLKILSVSYLFTVLSTVPALSADAFGKPYITTLFSVISAVINLIAAIVLIPRYGINGAAIAFAINIFGQLPLFLYYVNNKIIGIKVSQLFIKELLKPSIAGILLFIIYLLVYTFSHNIINTAAGIIAGGFVYIIMLLSLRTFDKNDWELVKSFNIHLINKFIMWYYYEL